MLIEPTPPPALETGKGSLRCPKRNSEQQKNHVGRLKRFLRMRTFKLEQDAPPNLLVHWELGMGSQPLQEVDEEVEVPKATL